MITTFKELSHDWKETQFTEAIRDGIASVGGYSLKLGASQFMAKGTPDTIYFLAGVTFLIESKVHPFKVSAIQVEQLRRIRAGTGCAWAATLRPLDGVMTVVLDDGWQFTSLENMVKHCVNIAKIQARDRELRHV
jgi:hypothetical protein